MQKQRSVPSYRTNLSHLYSDSSQRIGNMRAIHVDGKIVNMDQSIGMRKAIEESLNYSFGERSIEEQLEADKKAYEMKIIF
jgi:hypothetical protein